MSIEFQNRIVEQKSTKKKVSHAREVLNEVCTDITHLNHQKLKFYKGNYDTYEQLYANEKALLEKQHAKQQDEISHMKEFIDKFRFNAKRASMVQSRIKAINRLPLLDDILSDPTLSFHFEDPEPLPAPMLLMDEANFEYDTSDGITGKPYLFISKLRIWCSESILHLSFLKMVDVHLENADFNSERFVP